MEKKGNLLTCSESTVVASQKKSQSPACRVMVAFLYFATTTTTTIQPCGKIAFITKSQMPFPNGMCLVPGITMIRML